MKAYKIEILVIDFDGLSEEGILREIENARYANDCITPQVKEITCRDIGQWTDDHPLNKQVTSEEEYRRIFDKTHTDTLTKIMGRINNLADTQDNFAKEEIIIGGNPIKEQAFRSTARGLRIAEGVIRDELALISRPSNIRF